MSDQYRDTLLTALPASNLPPELVVWLVQGLEVQAAGGDMLEALGLEGPDRDRRDDLIRTVVDLSPGKSLTARTAFFAGCLDGNQIHPRNDMQRLITTLRLMNVPRTGRHLARIVNGRRQDGWREVGHESPFVSDNTTAG